MFCWFNDLRTLERNYKKYCKARANVSSTATIIKYDALTRIATLNAPLDTDWESSDNYIIRKSNPLFRGVVPSNGGTGGGIQKSGGGGTDTTAINNAVISANIKTAGTGYTAGSNYSSGSNFQISLPVFASNANRDNEGLVPYKILSTTIGLH